MQFSDRPQTTHCDACALSCQPAKQTANSKSPLHSLSTVYTSANLQDEPHPSLAKAEVHMCLNILRATGTMDAEQVSQRPSSPPSSPCGSCLPDTNNHKQADGRSTFLLLPAYQHAHSGLGFSSSPVPWAYSALGSDRRSRLQCIVHSLVSSSAAELSRQQQ